MRPFGAMGFAYPARRRSLGTLSLEDLAELLHPFVPELQPSDIASCIKHYLVLEYPCFACEYLVSLY